MAMSRPARPSLLVYGTVNAVTPRQAYDRDSKRYTDEVIGYEVTVGQENGSILLVRYALEAVLPSVLDRIAVYADVNESREYGVTLTFQRNVIPDDLDRINSSLAVSSKA